MKKKTELAKIINEKLTKSPPSKKPITLSLNADNFDRLQQECEDYNKKIDAGKIKTRKRYPSHIIDMLIAEYLDGKS